MVSIVVHIISMMGLFAAKRTHTKKVSLKQSLMLLSTIPNANQARGKTKLRQWKTALVAKTVGSLMRTIISKLMALNIIR